MELISAHWHNNGFGIFFYSIFSKGTQLFDLTKPKVIWKLLTYKCMYISQINWGLIFFRNLRITFFKLVGSILNKMEKINTKKGT